GVHIPAGRTGFALFRLQLNHAVGGIGAIHYVRRRSAGDLHALEIARIDVVETGWGLSSHTDGDGAGAVLDTNPVHIDDGLIGKRKTVGAPDTNARPGSGRDRKSTRLNSSHDQ